MSDRAWLVGMSVFLVLMLLFMVTSTIASLRDGGSVVFGVVSVLCIGVMVYAVVGYIRECVRAWHGEEDEYGA